MSYRIDHELGRGGMAVVYAGYQEGLDRPVALKVLAEHLAGDDEFRKRFLREARIASRLHHPNLVHTFDITEHDGLPCIVMELLPGGTLVGGTLTRQEAAEVAAAIAYAHADGVVHRDLKPANLLRGRNGEVKVADFGIARAAEETRVTQVGTVLGTLRYLSPEQAEGRAVGPATDVYSLGVVFDELLADRTPADRDLLTSMVDPDPELRPTAGEVAERLRRNGRPANDRAGIARHAVGPGRRCGGRDGRRPGRDRGVAAPSPERGHTRSARSDPGAAGAEPLGVVAAVLVARLMIHGSAERASDPLIQYTQGGRKMAELTNLESKLGEVVGLAMAAQAATQKVAKLARDDGNDDVVSRLERMHEEAKETEERGTEVAGTFDGKKTAILDEAREVKQKAQEMMSSYLDQASDALDGFEFLTMAEAGEVGHWEILGTLNERAGKSEVSDLVTWALPIQKRHLETVRTTSLELAADEDPNETG